MNLFKSPLRRVGAVAAGSALGLTGVLAFAGPAAAHHPIIKPVSSCVNADGTWVVKWKVDNSESIDGKVKKVEARPDSTTSLTGIKVDDVLPKSGQGHLEAVQTLPKDANKAVLKVTVSWDRGKHDVIDSKEAEQYKPQEKCAPTTPPSSPAPSSPAPSSPAPSSPAPSSAAPSSSAPSSAPPSSSAPSSSAPSSTPPSSGTPTSSAPTVPTTEPNFVYEATCEVLTVGITIPATWDEDIKVKFTSNKGETKNVTGKRGETTTVDFPAAEGLIVTATPEGYEGEGTSIAYEAPADCDTEGNGGGLPVTGAAAGGIAGGAAALLGVGGVLFYLARRRKLKFTA